MYITQFRFGKINSNHDIHMYIVCIILQEFGEKAEQMCILWRKKQEDKKGKNVLRNSICFAIFIENRAMYVSVVFTKCQQNYIFSMKIRLMQQQ